MADKMADRLNGIVSILGQNPAFPLNGTLLYADVEPGVVGKAIFNDRGNYIAYRDDVETSPDLFYMLLDLWEEAPPQKRWVDIELFIHDGKFDATFVYRDQMGGRRGSGRRDEVLRKYYGDKPVVYPPLDDGMGGWSFTLNAKPAS